MKKIKNRIYIDSWRKINEKLFTAYISCYNKLSKDSTLTAADELVKALSDNGILGKVTSNDYGSAYIPAREIGIFYNDESNNTILGTNAQKFIAGKLSYEDYMKQYVLNYRALINGNIISPFEIIRDHSLTGSVEKKADQIFKDCNKYFSDGSKDSLAKAGMIKFIERAIEANLISGSNKTYKILDPEIYNIKLSKFEITTDDFQERYLGGSIKAQENYVKEIIDQSVPIPKSRNTMSYPLNQILFGPPGTGKTYSTITKALNIVGLLEEKETYTKEEYEAAQELFQNELGKRIGFVTMHQSFSYEDFVQGLKPKKSEDGNGIVFDYKNGVFKEICRRASEYSDEGISETLKKDISHNDKLIAGFFISKFNGRKKEDQRANQALNANGFSEAFKLISDKLDIKVNTIKAYRDQFDYKFDHRNGYAPKNSTISVQSGLGKLDPPYDVIYNEYVNKSFEEVYDEVEQIFKKSKNTHLVESISTNDNFVIILDEINRANISRVFGELIALIEKDKRDGKLTVTLPSGEPFTVPSNLHIIGTMNTADKSIALVDIALRRRFEFIPLYPDPKILKQILEEKGLNKKDTELRVELFTNLNRIIRAKKSVDFEIGHSYFMEDENLIDILNKQVLPLLNEYFMYDLKKVKDILEKQQKDREGKEIPKLGITLNKSVWENRGLLKVESINDSKEKETTAAAVKAE